MVMLRPISPSPPSAITRRSPGLNAGGGDEMGLRGARDILLRYWRVGDGSSPGGSRCSVHGKHLIASLPDVSRRPKGGFVEGWRTDCCSSPATKQYSNVREWLRIGGLDERTTCCSRPG